MSASTDSSVLLFTRGFARGVLSVRRERGFGASLLALFGVAMILQLFACGWFAALSVEATLATQNVTHFSLLSTATDQRVQEFLIAARDLPAVASVDYVTRQQMYEEQRAISPDFIRTIEQFNLANPFSDNAVITLKSIGDYEALAAFARAPAWQGVVDSASVAASATEHQRAQELFALTQTGKTLSLAFLLLSGIILLFVVTELVRRRARSKADDLLVERMAGAEELSIALPFAVEAFFLIVISMILSIACLGFLFMLLPLAPSLAQNAAIDTVTATLLRGALHYWPFIFLFELLLAGAVSAFGAAIGSRAEA